MKQLSLLIDLERCTGCKTCIVACRNHFGIVDHATAVPNEIPYYLRVEQKSEGTYPDVSTTSWVVPCQHCKDPACITACPVEGAITKDTETGIVLIDKEKCIGCKACIPACPYDVIQFNDEDNVVHKCDLCFDQIRTGGIPVCVETCLADAMKFGEKEVLEQQVADEGREIDTELSAESILYIR